MRRKTVVFVITLVFISGCHERTASNRIGDSMLVRFTELTTDNYYELVGSKKLKEFQSFVDGMTEPGCNGRMQIMGDETELYFPYSNQKVQAIFIYAQTVPGVGGKRNPDRDQNLLASQDERREKIIDYIKTEGRPVSESGAKKEINKILRITDENDCCAVADENTIQCRSWKK